MVLDDAFQNRRASRDADIVSSTQTPGRESQDSFLRVRGVSHYERPGAPTW